MRAMSLLTFLIFIGLSSWPRDLLEAELEELVLELPFLGCSSSADSSCNSRIFIGVLSLPGR